MFTQTILKLEELQNKSIEEVLKSVLSTHKTLTIQFPNGAEVVISPKVELKPLPVLEGYIPIGWKEAIYDESE
jgi:hypothetical protein